jgi:anti-sigma factor RsiW
MRHGISEAEWLEYVSGTLGTARAGWVRMHLAACQECAQTFHDLSRWHDLLSREGAHLRRALAVSDREMEDFVARSMQRIRADSEPPNRGWSAAEGKFLLRSLMEPIFGVGTARATMDLAVLRSTTLDEGSLTGGNWRLFVANLSEAVASICGSTAGRLVNHVGIGLAIEEA